ncbi:MAG: Gfo/Idh/MocA family protein [Candidatus Brocadiia bacterium]
MRTAAAAGAAFGGFTILGATAKGQGKVFKVGLVGCGGRGNGALGQHVNAAKILNDSANLGVEVKVVATADFFEGRAERTGKKYGVPKERCFSGPDAYHKFLETDVDTMLTAAPPVFRPVHFKAAVEAGKHVFMEKPVAVDPVGCRTIVEAGEVAKKKGLMVVAGTQRRHQRGYIQRAAEIHQGAYGRVLGGRVSWCMGRIFSNNPINPKGPGDLAGPGKWQLWVEMSGDHIVEQHVHNIDIANWFLGSHPVSAVGFGHRARRKAGNMYDFFSLDLEYPDHIHVHSMCRQVAGCWNWVGEDFTFEHGKKRDFKLDGPIAYADVPQKGGGHQQEHINMLYCMVKGQYINEAQNVAWATATAVMGRDAAYSGQKITWEEMMENPKKNPEYYNKQLEPTAKDFETGNVKMLEDGDIRVPGKA